MTVIVSKILTKKSTNSDLRVLSEITNQQSTQESKRGGNKIVYKSLLDPISRLKTSEILSLEENETYSHIVNQISNKIVNKSRRYLSKRGKHTKNTQSVCQENTSRNKFGNVKIKVDPTKHISTSTSSKSIKTGLTKGNKAIYDSLLLLAN